MTVAGRRLRARCPFPFPLALVVAAALVAFPAAAVAIQGADVVSNPGADKTYATGDTIEVAVSFDGPVWVTHDPSLTFTLQIWTAAQEALVPAQRPPARTMRFVDGSGSRRLLFRYRVQEDDADDNGISFARTAIRGGTLRDVDNVVVDHALPSDETADSHLVDGVAPRASGPRIVSDAGDDDTYAVGDHIDLEVSFDEDVEVSGAPELLISIGTLSRAAALLDARPQRLTFRYIVQSGDQDDENGVSVQADALRGGTIRDAAGSTRSCMSLRPVPRLRRSRTWSCCFPSASGRAPRTSSAAAGLRLFASVTSCGLAIWTTTASASARRRCRAGASAIMRATPRTAVCRPCPPKRHTKSTLGVPNHPR